ELTWTLPDGSQKQQKLTLESGQTEQSIVEVAIPAVAAGGAKSQVTLAYQLQGTPLSGAQSLQVESVLLIPSAGMSDREADFKMMTRKNIVNPNDADPTRAHLNWRGDSDLSAQCWLSLQGDALVMRLVVTDDKHNQPHPIEDAWQADSIQMAFTVPGRSGSWVLMMARSNQGADMFQVSQAPVGLTRAIEGKVVFESKPQAGGGKMVYELRLPLKGLGMDAGQLRSEGLRFNLIINDADDAGREGFAFVAPGMGFGKYENERWPGMIFE
ncbi:MAG: hypothetical protein HC898_07290, partial [Phycisphaerales bacterium]|nr:hypothetical protein [Phycisphaerales bacterium]